MLTIRTLTLGPFQTNCHILQKPETSETVIVDPGDEGPRVLREIERLGARVVAIWNTHGHIDHINANAAVQEATGAPITIHALEDDWLRDPIKNLAAFAGIPLAESTAAHHWEDRREFAALGRQWTAHHTPGHSPGSVCLACAEENLLVAGDLLMAGSIGRVDFPGSSPKEMQASLRRLFEDWGRDDWRVLSGHGPDTTIDRERASNPLVADALAGRLE